MIEKGNHANRTRLRRHNTAAVMLSLLALVTFGPGLVPARASIPGLPLVIDDQLTSIAAAPGGGFWIQLQDKYECPPACTPTPPGYTIFHDGAPVYEQLYHAGLIAAVPGTDGYWIVTLEGKIHSRGGARQLCNGSLGACSGFSGGPFASLTAVAATPSGHGLWAVGRDGAVWTAGDARSFGDVIDKGQVPTGIAPTPSGNGYYIAMADGGVYSFGDAVFYGSTGGNKPGGHDVTGIAVSVDAAGAVNGYWLVAEDGGVFSYGNAPFWGSSGGNDHRVTSIVSFPAAQSGNGPRTVGYAWVNDKGQVSMCTKDRTCGGIMNSVQRSH